MFQSGDPAVGAEGVTVALGAVLFVFVVVILLALSGLGNKWRWIRRLGGVHLVALGAAIVSPALLVVDTAAIEALAAPVAGLLVLLAGRKSGWGDAESLAAWFAGLDGVKVISVSSLFVGPVALVLSLTGVGLSLAETYAVSTALGGLVLLYAMLVSTVTAARS